MIAFSIWSHAGNVCSCAIIRRQLGFKDSSEAELNTERWKVFVQCAMYLPLSSYEDVHQLDITSASVLCLYVLFNQSFSAV